MATLGEAFISVRADMKPFRRDLKNEVQKAADDVEKALGAAVEKGITSTAKSAGQKAGDDAGDGIAQGIKRKTGDKSKEPWVAFVGAFAGALDDGISALPTELKAAIVLGLIAVSPLIIGGLSGAIAAGIAAGVAGLGILLGSQFTSVQDRWMELNTFMRNTLIVTARSFEPVLLNVFDIFEGRLRDLDPKLTQLFDKASTFVIPLTEALFDALDFIVDSLNTALGGSDVFVEELAKSFAILGS